MDNALLSPKDAAKYLGVSRATIYRLIERGELPVYRPVPDAPRFKVRDLDLFVEGKKDDPHTVTLDTVARSIRHMKGNSRGDHG